MNGKVLDLREKSTDENTLKVFNIIISLSPISLEVMLRTDVKVINEMLTKDPFYKNFYENYFSEKNRQIAIEHNVAYNICLFFSGIFFGNYKLKHLFLESLQLAYNRGGIELFKKELSRFVEHNLKVFSGSYLNIPEIVRKIINEIDSISDNNEKIKEIIPEVKKKVEQMY